MGWQDAPVITGNASPAWSSAPVVGASASGAVPSNAALSGGWQPSTPLSNTQDFSLPFNFMGVPLAIPGAAVVGAGDAFNKLVQGARQAWDDVTGNKADAAVQDAQQSTSDAQMRKLYGASPAARAGAFVGEAAPLAGIAALTGQPELVAGPLRALAYSAGIGGALSALPYTPPGQSTRSNVLQGAVSGALFQLPFSTLGALARPVKSVLTGPQQRAVEDAEFIPGYQPLPSQVTGSPTLANVEKVISYLPFGGGQMAARNAANNAARNEAVLEVLGAPQGTQFGTQQVLGSLKDQATDVLDSVRENGAPVQILGTPQEARLQAIRDQASRANTPSRPLIGTLDKILGRPGSLLPGLASWGAAARQQAIDQLGPAAYVGGSPSAFANGIPQDIFSSIQSDLSDMSKGAGNASSDAARLAGSANAVLDDAQAASQPGNVGADYQLARQRYGALMAAAPAFDQAGNVSLPMLTQQLKFGPDIIHFGETSNPLKAKLADIANIGRAIPGPPAAGSDTAQKIAWQKWISALAEAGVAGAAALGGHLVGPGAIAGAIGGGAALPIAASLGARAYLSPAFMRYVRQGLPTLADIAQIGAPFSAGAGASAANQ